MTQMRLEEDRALRRFFWKSLLYGAHLLIILANCFFHSNFNAQFFRFVPSSLRDKRYVYTCSTQWIHRLPACTHRGRALGTIASSSPDMGESQKKRNEHQNRQGKKQTPCLLLHDYCMPNTLSYLEFLFANAIDFLPGNNFRFHQR